MEQKGKAPDLEERAFEMLQSDQPLDFGEQERLVLKITDADSAVVILMLTERVDNPRSFTEAQREHLAACIGSNPEAVVIFFMHLKESEIETLNATERWLAKRLLTGAESSFAEDLRADIPPHLVEQIDES